MKLRFLNVLIVPALAIGFAACEVQQGRQGELPDVQVEEGRLPEYQVETGEIDIERDTVTVPDIDVETPDEAGTDRSGTGASGNTGNTDRGTQP